MKQNYLKNKIIICLMVLCYFSSYGQIQDGMIDDPGDIVFVAFHDTDDGFSFLFLDDCPDGTSIRFIDEGWDGSMFYSPTGEGEVLWVNDTGATISSGTVIDITDADDNTVGIQASLGTATEDDSEFTTGVANDQIYAVTGTRAAPGTFLTFVGDTQDGSSGAASLSGTGLVAGSTALILLDNEGYYSGGTSCNGTIEECAAMFNNPLNWTVGNFSFPGAIPDIIDGSAVTPDTTDPQVQSITRQTPTTSPTNADTLTWDVTFDEAVSNVDTTDFTLTGTTATIAGVTNPSGNTYRVSVSGGDLANVNATVTLSFSSGQNITDSAGNTLTNTTPTGTNNNTFVVDNTAPSIAISAPSTDSTSSGPITYTVTYTDADAVTLADGDVSLNTTGDATASIAVSGSGTTTRTVTISSITGDGTIGISIAADTASDTVGNSALAAGPSATFTVDNTAPFIMISPPSASSTNSGPITYTITYTDADAVTLANGDISLNTTGDATGNIAVTGSGTTTRTVTISSITGNGTIGISIAANTASDVNGNNALAPRSSPAFTVDNIAPTIVISAPNAGATNSGPITYTITYSGADAITLANGDVSLNTTGDATGNIAVTGSGTTSRTVTISSITGNGTIGISIAANTASDTSGNNALAAGPSATFTVDNTAPTIVISAPNAGTTNSGPITYTITYAGADAVTLANGDVSLNTTGDATGSIAVTGAGTTSRTVTISSITGDGTIGISIAANTASDTSGNNALTAGPSATFTVDNTAPVGYIVLIDQSPINSVNEDTVNFRFSSAELGSTYNYTFSSDGGGSAVTGSGTITSSREMISGIDLSGLGDGTITLSVTLTDSNGNTGSAATDTETKKTSQPTVTITSTESSPTGASPIPATITFNESVTDFAIGDLTVVNGTLDNFSGSGATYTVDITPSSNGVVTLDIDADVATDNFGNSNTAASQFSITYDDTLSIQDDILANGLNIYPIPAGNIITIASETNLGLQNVKLFDLQGKLILSKKLDANNNTNTVDISSMHSGLYLMYIFSENGFTTKRVIKQ